MAKTVVPAQARKRRHNRPGRAEPAYWDLQKMHPELASVLTSSRWEQREEPFTGFGSPQGKF